MKTIHEITDAELRNAEWINAVDRSSGHSETVWGLDDPPGIPPQQHIDIVDVELGANDLTGLLRLLDRVEQAKGRLSPRVQAIRQKLQTATAGRTPAYSDQDLVIADCFHN